MNFDFEKILFYLVVITGIIALVDIFYLRKIRQTRSSQHSYLWRIIDITAEYSRSFFPVLLLVFGLRSFLYEMYRIPSGSLKPSMLVGDFPLINKFDYGIRLPVIHKKIIETGSPQRGDILVLHWPVNPSIYMIKRVIGLPGDRISYIDKVLTINGQKIPQTFTKNMLDTDDTGMEYTVAQNKENLLGKMHDIYLIPGKSADDFKEIIVPKNMYFVMGDNRDASADSRYWGFVPDENIVGKAVMVVMSWDSLKHRLRIDRFFMKVP